MITKKAKVIMLPTKTSNIGKQGVFSKIDYLRYQKKIKYTRSKYVEPQHLYITTDDEIKENDWYIYNNELLRQFKSKYNHRFMRHPVGW